MRIGITGSRSVTDKDTVYGILDGIVSICPGTPVFLHGGAKGVDSLVEEYCKEKGYDCVVFRPYHILDHNIEYHPKFFFMRNKQIVENSEVVFAIGDGKSRGTQHCVDYAKKHEKFVNYYVV